MVATLVRPLLLKSLLYANGKWTGEIECVIVHNEQESQRFIPFMYDRTWHVQAFKYPTGTDEPTRQHIKHLFQEQFHLFSTQVATQFFLPREAHGMRPFVTSFELDDALSDRDSIYARFTLLGVDDTFFSVLHCIEGVWDYKIHTKKHALESYKTFYTWEDAVFDAVLDALYQLPNYRLLLASKPKKYKYK